MRASVAQRVCLPKRHNAACKIVPVPSMDCTTALVEDCKDEISETDAKRQWAHLPVIELVFQHLLQDSSARDTKALFSACGVCSSWRAAGQAIFFSNSWQRGSAAIIHPLQLHSLCPLTHATGGHIRCFVIRDSSSSRRRSSYKYHLYQGHDYSNRARAKYCLSAVQERGKRQFAIYLSHRCTGKPVARLSGNVMGTLYSLTSYLCGSSSGSSNKSELLQVSYKLRVRGMMLPRRMSVALPCPQQQQQQQQQHLQVHRRCSSGSSTDCEITIVGADHPDDAAQHSDQLHSSRSSSNKACKSSHKAVSYRNSSSNLVYKQQQQQQQQVMHYLHNKAPHWNEGLRCWCLNFRGRVKLASVKNFQLIRDHITSEQQQLLLLKTNSSSSSQIDLSPAGSSDIASISSSSTVSVMSESLQDHQHCRPVAADATTAAAAAAAAGQVQGSPHTHGIITQFGKVERDTFILDYDPVLITAVQAFGVALTSFGAKMML